MSMGEDLKGLIFPVCNKFKGTIKDKQACYSLDLKEILSEVRGKTKQGKGNGLFFGINMEMSANTESSDSERELNNNAHIDTRRSTINENGGAIHISTLERFSDSRPGMYVMTVLKRMTGTESFLSMSDGVKQCEIETQDDCESRNYIENVQNQCHCLPWSLGNGFLPQVRQKKYAMYKVSKCSGEQLLHSKCNFVCRQCHFSLS